MTGGKRNALGAGSEGASRIDGFQTASADSHLTVLDDIAAHVDGAFVVVVKVTGGKYRRRCYLSVKAAQNAAARAVELGETATVYLAELKPLWKVRA